MISKAKSVSAALKAQLDKDGQILEKFPLQEYIRYLDAYPDVQDYNVVSPEVKQYCKNFAESSSDNRLDIYHRLLLCKLIIRSGEQLQNKNVSPNIKELFIQNFAIILEDLEKTNANGDYMYPNDKFLKNLAICHLRLIPAGARKINQSVLPIKNFMFKKGLRQFLALAYYIATELRGIKPLYIGHLDTNDPFLVKNLNPDGLKNTYIRVAEMLKSNPKVKGYFGTSWMLDPQLDNINTRHRYSRHLATENGGKLYYKGPSKIALRNSLAKSKTRRRLYEEGKYIPTDYVIVWSRQKLIRWAEMI